MFASNRTLLCSLLLAFAAAFAGCDSSKTFVGQCTKNDDCGVGAFCKKTPGNESGICACRSDEACKDGEICNSQGICQARSACRANSDCDADKFCDIASGNCIARTACGTDIHCLPGSVCDPASNSCKDGCLDDGDCPLYSSCDRTGVSAGQFGRCLMGRCSDKDFCQYGYDCSNSSCVRDTNPNFCKDCSADRNCGDPRNFCLVNSAYDPRDPHSGSEQFCGVECQSETDCPSGYQCGGVVLLTQDQCTNDNECGGGGRRCVIGEGDLRGFCTCVTDQDCAFDSAPPSCLGSCSGLGLQPCRENADCISNNCVLGNNGQCQWPQGQGCSRDDQCQPLPICAPIGLGGSNACVTDGVTPCQTAADCACTQGSCIGSGRPCSNASDCNISCEGGGCVLGRACAPLQGLTCPDVVP